MDPVTAVGLASSITSLVEFSFKIVKYLEGIKEGGKDRRRLNDEVISLWMSLRTLEAQAARETVDHDDAWLESIQTLAEPNGIFEQIRTSLNQIATKLTSTSASLPAKVMLTLRWPLDKEEVDRIITRIDRLKNSVILALSQANISLAKETRDDVSMLKKTMKDRRLGTIIDWISPLNFRPRQQAIRGVQVPGTGAWFFKHRKFLNWVLGEEPVLWCPGIPGAGKTVLASTVVDKLHALHDGQNIAALIVYCSYDNPDTQSIDFLISSLLKQVLQISSTVSDELETLYHNYSVNKSRPSITELCKHLSSSFKLFDKVFIVLDALDEMQDESQRLRLLDCIQSLDGSPNWMVTSRPLDNIACHFGFSLRGGVYCDGCEARRMPLFYHCKQCATPGFDVCQDCYEKEVLCPYEGHDLIKQYSSSSFEIAAQPEDISTYILWRIDQESSLRQFVSKKQGLQQQILETVKERAREMFLLARFYMDELADQLTPAEVLAALNTLPREIDKTYDQTTQRINKLSTSRQKRVHTLMLWLVYAERLMTIAEIEHAITVMPGMVEINKDDIPSAAVLTSMCAGLVFIDEADNVRLAHETVGKYLKSNQKDLFPAGESTIASSCLTYLHLDAFNQGACFGTTESIDFEERKQCYPLLGYAALYWGTHTRRSNALPIVPQTLAFLNSESHLAASVQAIWYTDMRGLQSWDAKDDVSALHIAAYFGLDRAVSQLLAHGANKNAQDSLGTTPLMYASTEGHATVVEILLHSGASANTICHRGSSALHRAAAEGHSKIVQQLLSQKDVALNALHTSVNHWSALMLAASRGHLGTVKLLLDRPDLQVNQETSYPRGWTALTLAAVYGETQIVKVLLDRPDIHKDHQESDGSTALILAASRGQVPVVEALLNKGASTELRDDQGGTAFLRAIDYNQFSVVRFLNKQKVDYTFKDYHGRTVIHGAACNNRSTILRLLLESDSGLDVNAQGNLGETALHDTARFGYIESTRVLLDFGARTDIKDNAQRTPLRIARDQGIDDMFELLKEAREQEVSLMKPESSATPLVIEENLSPVKRADTLLSNYEVPFYIAVQRKTVDELQTMIDLAGPDREKFVNQTDPNIGSTPLDLATKRGRLDVVDMLLKAGASQTILDMYKRSPLHYAALTDKVEIARCLIDNGADLNVKNAFDETPWEEALRYASFSVALFLIESGATIRQDTNDLRSLISLAAYLGNLKVVQRLVEMGVAFQLPSSNGLTPYKIAKSEGHEDVAQYLFEATSTYRLTNASPLTPIEYPVVTSGQLVQSSLATAVGSRTPAPVEDPAEQVEKSSDQVQKASDNSATKDFISTPTKSSEVFRMPKPSDLSTKPLESVGELGSTRIAISKVDPINPSESFETREYWLIGIIIALVCIITAMTLRP